MTLKLRALAASFLVLVSSMAGFALEIREGLVKIVVDESIGRFSLYRLVDVARDRYEALFFDQDPRTSSLILSFEGRQYKLGDSADFRQSISRSETGVVLEWKSSFARVTERIDFARSVGAAIADGIKLSMIVENVSQADAQIGLRLLIDTYLGEKSGLHFRTPTRERMSVETVFEGSVFEGWAATPGDASSSFMLQFVGDGLDRPDRVHFANWKRLNDAAWQLDASSTRNFTLLPYSVNDSAVALYWQPRAVVKGASFSATTAMGAFNEKGYPVKTADSGTDALFTKTVLSAQTSGDPESLMSADILAVRDLLSRIDLVLSNGIQVSPDEIASWKKILDLLEERKKGY